MAATRISYKSLQACADKAGGAGDAALNNAIEDAFGNGPDALGVIVIEGGPTRSRIASELACAECLIALLQIYPRNSRPSELSYSTWLPSLPHFPKTSERNTPGRICNTCGFHSRTWNNVELIFGV